MNKYRTFGIERYGVTPIAITNDSLTMMTPSPVPARSVSKQEIGELTYYGVCAECHAFATRLIGPPTEFI